MLFCRDLFSNKNPPILIFWTILCEVTEHENTYFVGYMIFIQILNHSLCILQILISRTLEFNHLFQVS